MAHGQNTNISSYYDGNYTYMRLSSRKNDVLTDYFYKKYFFKNYKGYKSSKYQIDAFNIEFFIKDFKTYIFSLSKKPITNESLVRLEGINRDEYDSSDWCLEIFVSNDIFIKVFERYFKLIDSLTSGAYVWEYFKSPLSLDFISDNILDSELNRRLLAGTEFNRPIDSSLWLSLFLNSAGYYINPDKHLNSKYSFPEIPNIQNCLSFIDKFKDEVDWSVIQSYYPGKFSISFIDTYKDYLLFHNHAMKMHDGKLVFEKVFNYIYENGKRTSQKEWKIVSGSLHNRKGQTYNGCEYRLVQNEITAFEYGDDLGNVNLSLTQRVEWSAELLIKFQDYFSWDYLSENEYLPWSIELITAFEEKWNWKKISENNSIGFSSEILQKFKSRINFKSLSNNINVEWSRLGLYGSNRNKLDWNILSNNPSIDEKFIKENSDKIIFSGSRDGFDWNVSASVKGSTGRFTPEKSLSSNPNINWTDSLIQDYIKKLDFWLIALFGKITPELVVKYAAFFDESREYSRSWQKNSDWPSIRVHHFCSGWQNLKKNKNFTPSDSFFEFAKSREVRVYKPYEDEGYNADYIKGFIDPHESSNFRLTSVYDLFKP